MWTDHAQGRVSSLLWATIWGSHAPRAPWTLTRSLISKRLESLSRNSPSLPGSCAAAGVSSRGAGVLSSVPSRGTCLLKRRSVLCWNLVRLCESVLVPLC